MTQHSDPSLTLSTPATADVVDPLAVQRVRHPLKGRHVQVVRRTQISPGFVRLTLAGPDMAEFVSAGFDDHVKHILPSPGQERASQPQLVDGRPQFSEPRPVLRDYTPAQRWQMLGKWHVLMPLVTLVCGYFPGKRLGWMEDTPKGVALDWARITRCMGPSANAALPMPRAAVVLPAPPLALAKEMTGMLLPWEVGSERLIALEQPASSAPHALIMAQTWLTKWKRDIWHPPL